MSDWIRVSKANPCPICQKDSWCTYNDEVVICMRMASERPHLFKTGETGYIHRLNGERPKPFYRTSPVKPPKDIDAEALMQKWRKTTDGMAIGALASRLGVAASALLDLKPAWAAEYQAWAFPMRNGNGKAVGIRLRSNEGAKFAVTGSKQGIFLPYCHPQDTALLCEGPTGCAAGLSLGFYSVGRPSCSGGVPDLKVALPRLGVRRVVIVADNDDDKESAGKTWNPGLDGAASLARTIGLPCCTIILPVKDLRDFLKAGGDHETLDNIIESCVWRV